MHIDTTYTLIQALRGAQHLYAILASNAQPQPNHEKASNKTKLGGILQITDEHASKLTVFKQGKTEQLSQAEGD